MEPVKRSPFFNATWSARAGIARRRKRKLTAICLRTVLLLVFQQNWKLLKAWPESREEKLRNMGLNVRIPVAHSRQMFQPRLKILNLDATWPHDDRLPIRIWVVRSGPAGGAADIRPCEVWVRPPT